jgi:hypothetical protein
MDTVEEENNRCKDGDDGEPDAEEQDREKENASTRQYGDTADTYSMLAQRKGYLMPGVSDDAMEVRWGLDMRDSYPRLARTYRVAKLAMMSSTSTRPYRQCREHRHRHKHKPPVGIAHLIGGQFDVCLQSTSESCNQDLFGPY